MSKLFAISTSDSFVVECIDKFEAEEFARDYCDAPFKVMEITRNTAEPLDALNYKISHIGAEDFMAQYCE